MLTTIIRTVPKLTRSSYRLSSVSRRTMVSIGEQFNKKEKVEEDRFMRAQEQVWKDKLRQLRAEEEVTKVQELHDQVVEPVKKNIAQMLRSSGDSISDEGLEALAKWKLGL